MGLVLMMLANTANAAAPTLTLQLKSDGVLTSAVAISVVVANRSAAPITIEDPRASTHASVHVVDLDTHEDHSFSMGQNATTDLGHGQFALVVPVVKPVTLAAGRSLEVRVDANERLFLHPGTFDVFFSLGDLQSNHVALTVRFTEQSLERLLALAADAKASYARREWAVELLKRVKRDFALTLPAPEATEQERAPLETANRAAIESLRQWVAAQPPAELARQLRTLTR
ncbi:MAG: hypothetical protein GQE15_31495 [Archangiaceae bacterium]|nr:hypothetical protein [Archangiaceae bacterium]